MSGISLPELWLNGVGGFTIAYTILRVAIGGFFASSGYHKLFNAQRRVMVGKVMVEDRIPFPAFCAVFVPTVELLAGLGLLAGALTTLSALGLLAISLVATCTDALWRLPDRHPLDAADWIAKAIYLPEVLLTLGLFAILAGGPGALSLDRIVANIAGIAL
jgi:putative oxidoreductase